MNKDYILFHLSEAREQLESIIRSLEGKGYTQADYKADMQHLYYHMNIAWNAKDARDKRIKARRGEDLKKWRQFPVDLFKKDILEKFAGEA